MKTGQKSLLGLVRVVYRRLGIVASGFCELVGISYRAFKRWVSNGKIHVTKTPSDRIRAPSLKLNMFLERSQRSERPELLSMLMQTLATLY